MQIESLESLKNDSQSYIFSGWFGDSHNIIQTSASELRLAGGGEEGEVNCLVCTKRVMWENIVGCSISEVSPLLLLMPLRNGPTAENCI